MPNKFKELMRESAATEAESLVANLKEHPKYEPVKKDHVKKEPAEVKPSKEKLTKKKNLGGRPKNSDRGLVCRKQYTLTLEENTYQTFLNKAREEKISFAKFMEKAAYEYIKNNE